MAKTSLINNTKKEILRAPLHQKYYVTNVKGGLTSQDFRFELLNEVIGDEQKTFYVADSMIILSPIGAKRFLQELSNAVKEYETKNGVIPLDPKEEQMIDFSK